MDWQYELLAVFLLLPLLWWTLRNNQKNIEKMITNQKSCSEAFKIEMQKFYELFAQHTKEDDENFKLIAREISKAVGKTSLTNEQLIEIARNRVWQTSEKKLDFIKKRLEKNNLKIRRNIIEKQITTELSRRSDEYIDFLNQFTSSVWNVWEWIAKNFPMDDFLKEVFDVVFREDDNNLRKIEDIRFLMMQYQKDLFEEFKKELYA